MNFKNEFERIMKDTQLMCMGTSSNNESSVRMLNFVWDNEAKVVYISTFKGTKKLEDISENSHVSFTTLPAGSMEFVRVDNGVAKVSEKSVADLKDVMIKKYPHYANMYAKGLDPFLILEVRFTDAVVSVGHGQYDFIKI